MHKVISAMQMSLDGFIEGTNGEIDYANFADRTPHVVLSKTLKQVQWKAVRVARDVDALLRLKQRPGKDIYVVGGAALVVRSHEAGLPRGAAQSAARVDGRRNRHADVAVSVRRALPGRREGGLV